MSRREGSRRSPPEPVAEIDESDGRDLLRADSSEWESEYQIEKGNFNPADG